jgi:hypothetical protein
VNKEKIKKWICKIFWHKFDDVEMAMCQIKKSAINENGLEHYIKCKRCGKKIII